MSGNLATALELLFGYSPAIIFFILARIMSKIKRKNALKKNEPLIISTAFYAFALLLAIIPTVWLAMVILKISP